MARPSRIQSFVIWVKLVLLLVVGKSEVALDNAGLVSIPNVIRYWRHSRYLNFRNNSIASIPEFFCDMECLTNLDLTNNSIGSIPMSILKNPSLRVLRLGRNRLSGEQQVCSGAFKELRHLEMDRNCLVQIPEVVATARNLNIFNASFNKIGDMGNWLATLKHLQEINLSNNKLTALPRELFMSTELKYLYLRRNDIREVPAEVGQARLLRILDLECNCLRTLPFEISNTMLDILHIRDNLISPEIEKMYQDSGCEVRRFTPILMEYIRNHRDSNGDILWPKISRQNFEVEGFDTKDPVPRMRHAPYVGELELQYFRLNDISRNVDFPFYSSLRTLKRVDLSHNKITWLPFNMGYLTFLEDLNVSYNSISSTDMCLDKMIALRKLNMAQNVLKKWSATFSTLVNLEELNLSHNRVLSSLSEGVADCVSLKKLDISYTAVKRLPKRAYQWLNMNRIDVQDSRLQALSMRAEKKAGYKDFWICPESRAPVVIVKTILGYDFYAAEQKKKMEVARKHVNDSNGFEIAQSAAQVAYETVLSDQSEDVATTSITAIEIETREHELHDAWLLQDAKETTSEEISTDKVGKSSALGAGEDTTIFSLGDPSMVLGGQNDIASSAQNGARTEGELDLSRKGLGVDEAGQALDLASKRYTVIDLGKNPLLSLPESVMEFENLTVLRIDHAGLTWLPFSLISLSDTLRELLLGHNKFTDIPNVVFSLSKLVTLDVSWNQLSSLDRFTVEQIGSTIEVCLLDHNELVEVPSSIGSWKRLRRLGLSHNLLREIPDCFAEFKSLENVDVTYNRLKVIPKSLSDLKCSVAAIDGNFPA